MELHQQVIDTKCRHQCFGCDVATMGGRWGGLVDKGASPSHWIYVLKSEACGGWYYVGVTNNIHRRLNQHHSGSGAQCTRKWVFDILVALYKCPFDNGREQLEQVITHRWMASMPNQEWWRVRGGSHCSIQIIRNKQTDIPLSFLRKVNNYYNTSPTNPECIDDDPYLKTQCNCGFPCALETNGSEQSFLICPSAEWFKKSHLAYESLSRCDFRLEIVTPHGQQEIEELEYERELLRQTINIPVCLISQHVK